jgi:hypothetical protein
MSIPASIAAHAQQFARNSVCLEKAVDGIAPEQWLLRPNGHSNHLLWIVGHMLWARKGMIERLGFRCSQEGLDVFARSTKIDANLHYPPPEALLSAWRELVPALDAAFNAVTEEALAAPAPPGPPSLDGKLSGTVATLAWHETYHLGQISYLRGWLGQSGVFG